MKIFIYLWMQWHRDIIPASEAENALVVFPHWFNSNTMITLMMMCWFMVLKSMKQIIHSIAKSQQDERWQRSKDCNSAGCWINSGGHHHLILRWAEKYPFTWDATVQEQVLIWRNKLFTAHLVEGWKGPNQICQIVDRSYLQKDPKSIDKPRNDWSCHYNSPEFLNRKGLQIVATTQ